MMKHPVTGAPVPDAQSVVSAPNVDVSGMVLGAPPPSDVVIGNPPPQMAPPSDVIIGNPPPSTGAPMGDIPVDTSLEGNPIAQATSATMALHDPNIDGGISVPNTAPNQPLDMDWKTPSGDTNIDMDWKTPSGDTNIDTAWKSAPTNNPDQAQEAAKGGVPKSSEDPFREAAGLHEAANTIRIKALDDEYAAQMRAHELGTAMLRKQQADQAALEAEQQAASQAELATLQRHSDAFDSLGDEIRKASEETPDEGRYWADKSIFQKVSAVVAGALYGYLGQGMQWIQRLDSLAAQDVALQERNIGRKIDGLKGKAAGERTAFEMAMASGLPKSQARKAAQEALKNQAAVQMEIALRNIGDGPAKAAAQQQYAALLDRMGTQKEQYTKDTQAYALADRRQALEEAKLRGDQYRWSMDLKAKEKARSRAASSDLSKEAYGGPTAINAALKQREDSRTVINSINRMERAVRIYEAFTKNSVFSPQQVAAFNDALDSFPGGAGYKIGNYLNADAGEMRAKAVAFVNAVGPDIAQSALQKEEYAETKKLFAQLDAPNNIYAALSVIRDRYADKMKGAEYFLKQTPSKNLQFLPVDKIDPVGKSSPDKFAPGQAASAPVSARVATPKPVDVPRPKPVDVPRPKPVASERDEES